MTDGQIVIGTLLNKQKVIAMKRIIEVRKHPGSTSIQHSLDKMDKNSPEENEKSSMDQEESHKNNSSNIIEEYGGWKAYLHISRI